MGSENCGFQCALAKDAKKVRDAANRANGLWGIRLRCRKRGLTPLIIPNLTRHALTAVASRKIHRPNVLWNPSDNDIHISSDADIVYKVVSDKLVPFWRIRKRNQILYNRIECE